MIVRVRKLVWTALAAMIALPGCSGTRSEEAKSSPRPAPSSNTAGTPKTRDDGDEDAAPLTDSWGSVGARPDGEGMVILHIDGSRVELTGPHRCLGKVSDEDGLHVIRLTCDDGDTDRTVGRVYGLSAKTMTVDWAGFGADMFLRATHATDAA